MSGDKIRRADEDKNCPRCQRSKKAFASPHCPSPTCTWAKCPCGATYELYGGGSYHDADTDKKPKKKET